MVCLTSHSVANLSGMRLFMVVLMGLCITFLNRFMGFRVVVRKGDTIEGLSRELGLPREALLSANKGFCHAVPVSLLPGTPADLTIRQDAHYELLQLRAQHITAQESCSYAGFLGCLPRLEAAAAKLHVLKKDTLGETNRQRGAPGGAGAGGLPRQTRRPAVV